MITTNLPQIGLHMAQARPLNDPRIGPNMASAKGLIFPNMPRTMPFDMPSNTLDSFVVLRQQIYESHHDLVNMLIQQITTVLNPLIESNNARYE